MSAVWLAAVVAWAAVSGCGAATPTRPSDAPIDTPNEAGQVVCSGPWGALEPIPELNLAGQDANMRLTPDELTAVFQSDRDTPPMTDLYIASRTTAGEPFGTPRRLTTISGMTQDFDPSLSSDGLRIVFGRDGLDIYVASRTTLQADFAPPQVASGINAPMASEGQPLLSPHDDVIWLVSDRPGGAGSYDLYVAPLIGRTEFGAPAAITELSSPSVEFFPTPSTDGLTLYFASNRTDLGGAGDLDIYVATRAAIGVPFSPPERITELVTATDEHPTWISPDGCRLYVSSSITGNYDLYVARR